MKLPLQISYRDMEPSDAVEANIRERMEKLERFSDEIMSCRVMVEKHHHHRHKGNIFHIRIDLTVPGDEIVVSREPDKHHAHEDINVAIRDAFNAVTRQLEDYARKRHRKTKRHETPAHGRIIELVADSDYGRIETPDGRQIYFHRNSLLNEDFDDIEIGMEVRFDEEPGEEGPQASTVKIVGKHHVVG